MNFKKWVKSIQTTGYNGARTVVKSTQTRTQLYFSNRIPSSRDGLSLRKLIPQRTKFKILNSKIVELDTKTKIHILKTGLKAHAQTRLDDLKVSSELYVNEKIDT
jgi:hypothetical protein